MRSEILQELTDNTPKEIDLKVEMYAEFLDGLEKKSFKAYPIDNVRDYDNDGVNYPPTLKSDGWVLRSVL